MNHFFWLFCFVCFFFFNKNNTVFTSRTWARHVAHTYSSPFAKKYFEDAQHLESHTLSIAQQQKGEKLGAHLLGPALVCSLILVVDTAEVGDNYRNWQSNDQNPTQGAY